MGLINDLDKSKFLALYCMVLADGVIDSRELETLYRIGTNEYGLNPAEISESIKTAGTSFILPTDIEEKIALLYQMAQICVSDDEVDETEINLFERYALRMGFEEGNLKGIRGYLIQEAEKGTSQKDVIEKILNN